jgi:hypothetical protein
MPLSSVHAATAVDEHPKSVWREWGPLLFVLRIETDIAVFRLAPWLVQSYITPSAPHRSQLHRRELDWIVMKALEKDRTRRYETASGPGATRPAISGG